MPKQEEEKKPEPKLYLRKVVGDINKTTFALQEGSVPFEYVVELAMPNIKTTILGKVVNEASL